MGKSTRTSGPRRAPGSPRPGVSTRPAAGTTPGQDRIDALRATAADAHMHGDLDAARRGYEQLLELVPDDIHGIHLLGVVRCQQGDPEAGLALLDSVTDAFTASAPYHSNRGMALRELGRLDDAVDALTHAIACDATNRDSYLNLARIQRQLAMPDAAAATLRQGLAAIGDEPELLLRLGATLADQGRLRMAEAKMRRSIELLPDNPAVHEQLGDVLRLLGRLDEAADEFRRSIEIVHRHGYDLGPLGNLTNSLGVVLHLQHRQTEAIAALDEGLALGITTGISPDSAHFNIAIAALSDGDCTRGWAEWEHGFGAGQRMPDRTRTLLRPRWDRNPATLAGRTVMVWREQGIGDEILWYSCLPDVIRDAGHVIVECEPRLVSLLQRSFPTATVRAQAITATSTSTWVENLDDDRIDYDLHTPIGDLPVAYRPTPDHFPDTIGFLVPDPERVAEFRRRLDALGPGPKVGITWRSMLMTVERRVSYSRLDEWGSILTVPGAHFVNVQYDRCKPELHDAERRFGTPIAYWDDVDLKDDQEAIAALCAALDVVIGTANASAAMAGAVGTRVYEPATKTDSMRFGRNTYPWYPNKQVFQKSWDEPWTVVLDQIGGAIAALADTTMPSSAARQEAAATDGTNPVID